VADELDRRSKDRRSPLGDFLLSTLSQRGDEALALEDLLWIARDSGLKIDTVVAWVEKAQEGGLIEELSDPGSAERNLRLTFAGRDLARNNRRRVDRRARWGRPPDDHL